MNARSRTSPRRTALLALAAAAAVGLPAPLSGQSGQERDPGLRLMTGDVGIAIGNVPRVTGLRVNWSDHYLDEVVGVNVTLWRPADEGVGGRVRGVALGLAPSAGELSGIGIGVAAVVGERMLKGVHVSALATVSAGEIQGVAVGGVATVSAGRMRGVGVGGLALVANGAMAGVQVAGLAVVADGHLSGAQLSGLAVVGSGGLSGIQAGGMAVVSGEAMKGVQATLGRLHARDEILGVNVAGFNVRAPVVRGLTVVGGWAEAGELRGLAVAGGMNRADLQVGLSLALVNWADELRGIQVGIVNRAGNNRAPFRILPILNAHF